MYVQVRIRHLHAGGVEGSLDLLVDGEQTVPVIVDLDPEAQSVIDGALAVAHQHGLGLLRLGQGEGFLGGGGHQTMAAAQLKEESTNAAKLKLIEAIDKHLSTLSEQK